MDSLGVSGGPPLFYEYYLAPGSQSSSINCSKTRSWHAISMYSDVALLILNQKVWFNDQRCLITCPLHVPKLCEKLIEQLCHSCSCCTDWPMMINSAPSGSSWCGKKPQKCEFPYYFCTYIGVPNMFLGQLLQGNKVQQAKFPYLMWFKNYDGIIGFDT